MKIYVVEFMFDYTEQLGWSTSREVAEKKCKEYAEKTHRNCWVTEYTTGKKNWCMFNGD